eukprot:scaffold6685_cov202-Prasinococcus_capsulatus_cf.AAC.5
MSIRIKTLDSRVDRSRAQSRVRCIYADCALSCRRWSSLRRPPRGRSASCAVRVTRRRPLPLPPNPAFVTLDLSDEDDAERSSWPERAA